MLRNFLSTPSRTLIFIASQTTNKCTAKARFQRFFFKYNMMNLLITMEVKMGCEYK